MERTRREKLNRLLAMLIGIAVLVGALIVLSNVLRPKRFDHGSVWPQFLKEEKNSMDVMFFGTSRVYCGVMPEVIDENTGLSSYVMAGGSQTLPVTYYYVDEVLNTQHPDTIFVEISGIIYPHLTDSTRANLDTMPFGKNRIMAAFTDAEEAYRPGIIIPVRNYHSRWKELTAEDIRIGLFGYGKDPNKGYTLVEDVTPQSEKVPWNAASDKADYDRNLESILKINELCKKENIKAVFCIFPSMATFDPDFENRFKSDLAAHEDLIFEDFNEYYSEMGIDESTDYKDAIHFNKSGAEKYSLWLSDCINTERFAQ